MKSKLIAILCFPFIFSCNSPEARRPVSYTSGSFIKESAERNKKLNALEHSLIKTIINNNPNIDYLESEHGFWYYYENKNENDSITAQFGDIVNFDYDVSDLDDNIIYTKEEIKTQDYAMDQEELFFGLREGLKLMKTGETITFLFPSQIAYGYYGDENKIGTSLPIKCKVTLNSITQKEANENETF